MEKIRGEWKRCNRGWDYCYSVIVERNGKRAETVIYHKLLDTSVVLNPQPLSIIGAVEDAPKYISTRNPIDEHYYQIKEAVKRGLENVEPENEIRNYYW